MKRFLTNVAARFKKPSKARPAPRPRRACLGVEALEERLVMSGTGGWESGGNPPAPPAPNPWGYTVPSGHGSDTIQISVSGSYLQVLDNNLPVPGTPLYLPGITSISMQGGTNTVNKFLVQGTPAGIPVAINFATPSDSAVVGNAGSLQGIQGSLTINGDGGSSQVTVDDSAGPATAYAALYSTSLAGLTPMTMLFSGMPSVVVKANASAGNSITMYTPQTGYSTLTAAPGKSTLSGYGYSLEADNFAHVHAINLSSGGGASLYGLPAGYVNTYRGQPNYSTLTGGSYSIEADYFGAVTAYSNSPYDVASLWGMAGGTNTFYGQPGDASLWSNYLGTGYYEDAHGFNAVKAYAGSAGDTAYLTVPSSYYGKSTLVRLSTSSFLGGYGWGIQANNFSHVNASGNFSNSYAILVSIVGDQESLRHEPMDQKVPGVTVAVEVHEQVAPLALDLREQLVPHQAPHLPALTHLVVRVAGYRSPVVVGHRMLPPPGEEYTARR